MRFTPSQTSQVNWERLKPFWFNHKNILYFPKYKVLLYIEMARFGQNTAVEFGRFLLNGNSNWYSKNLAILFLIQRAQNKKMPKRKKKTVT